MCSWAAEKKTSFHRGTVKKYIYTMPLDKCSDMYCREDLVSVNQLDTIKEYQI